MEEQCKPTPEIQLPEKGDEDKGKGSNAWNSVEIAKLIATLITPFLVAYLGYLANEYLKDLDKRQWTNQKLIEKRLQLYDNLSPILNDLVVYYTHVGHFRDFSPNDIRAKKRELDRLVHVNKAIFSNQFYSTYRAFDDLYFKKFNCSGCNFRLSTSLPNLKRQFGKEWKQQWELEDYFVEEPLAIYEWDARQCWESLMSVLGDEVRGIEDSEVSHATDCKDSRHSARDNPKTP